MKFSRDLTEYFIREINNNKEEEVMKCYHHNDLDGRCAAAVIFHEFSRNLITKDQLKFIEVDYKDEINVQEIKIGEQVVIVDFSFRPEVMEQVLLKTENIIWLDHHKTAFEYKYPVDIKGLREGQKSGPSTPPC